MAVRPGDDDDAAVLQRWRLRHASPDAVGAWRRARSSEVGLRAFIAVGLDPGVLTRQDLRTAKRLATQAGAHVAYVARADPKGTSAWSVAACIVQAAVQGWRNMPSDGLGPAEERESRGAAVQGAAPSADLWQAALRNFPQFDARTGRAAAELVARSGGAVLEQARQPWNQLIALGTLRYAARVARGDIVADDQSQPELLGAVLAVRRVAERTGLSPMRVPYVGRHSAPALLAANLSQDAATLETLVREAPGAEPAAPWAEAEAMHAFAAVALDPEVLQTLDVIESLRLATAAVRFTELAGRAAPVQMPLLPRDCTAGFAEVAAAVRTGLQRREEAMVT
jgi:hypothetical protein